ncbi:MAG: hypothetical protein M3044_23720 [Thermoproteota archaeon]|nr:hypothetical protein [Thermoproteota archaeon]
MNPEARTNFNYTPLSISQKRTKHRSIDQGINISDEELQEIANYLSDDEGQQYLQKNYIS